MTGEALPNELGEFLKQRRSELTPRAVGLPDTGGRRVPGLRREEVAVLAAISADYYTRLEQGRVQPSASLLAVLSRVLHLSDRRRDRLFELAGRHGTRHRRPAGQKVHPQLRRLLDDLAASPGVVIGRRLDILAWNPLAAALFADFAELPESRRNCARILFTDPSMRTLYADWRAVARDCVARLRSAGAKHPADPRLTGLVGELSLEDADFGQLWGRRHVPFRGAGADRFRHPLVGEIVLDWDILTCGGDLDQEVVVWTAEPGSPSYDALRALASSLTAVRPGRLTTERSDPPVGPTGPADS
ncbi:helix-turn-helix domain-containing protein [Streptomyces sp. MBT49]|uniref:helix-turn-helix domain-containing protein n=1 Tax=Streptomyces sp. MBT49 TaxID=1488380 RepID=UPI00190D76E9|nr:helix-turn-helix domain-containing protein [Streptomyces sp. MBT49]MBK3625430.1 helix-turn-helix domain-containing protein [Streptomyces sp. MBT49]